MEAEFEARKQELLDECKISPQVFDNVIPRLETFMEPFVESLVRKEQVEHAQTFGLQEQPTLGVHPPPP